MQRSRPASRSAAISTPRAAAAIAPRSARALPSARLSRSLRRRLGSSPARPGPRGPLARPGGKTRGASLLQRGGEESRGQSVHSGRELGGGSVSPGSRRRHPPPTRDPHGRARGAETAGWGADAGARRAAHAHSRARAPPSRRAPSSRPGACRAPIPAVASRAAAAVEPSWRRGRGRRRARSPPPLLSGAGHGRGARASGAAAGVRETPEKRSASLPPASRS